MNPYGLPPQAPTLPAESLSAMSLHSMYIDHSPESFGRTKDGDAVIVRRSGFPVDIDTEPAPLERACGTDRCRQGRGAPCGAGCAEIISAQAEGARMAMGDQKPSEPMPLPELLLSKGSMTHQPVTWREWLRRFLSHAWHG